MNQYVQICFPVDTSCVPYFGSLEGSDDGPSGESVTGMPRGSISCDRRRRVIFDRLHEMQVWEDFIWTDDEHLWVTDAGREALVESGLSGMTFQEISLVSVGKHKVRLWRGFVPAAPDAPSP